jgi:histidinol dehydrogenase
MAPKYLKRGEAASKSSSAPTVDVAAIVKSVIDGIRSNGDADVRKYSEKFDRWSPEAFKLSKEDIDAAIAAVPQQTIEDIKQVQANVRKFAQAQRDSLKDFELETEPVSSLKRNIIQSD